MKQNAIQKLAVFFSFLLSIAAYSPQTFGQATQLTPFDCSTGLGYILTNTSVGGNNITSLSSFDLTSGVNTIIKANLLPTTPADQRFYNGFGYNTKDNYLYGYRYNTNQIVKVGADGNIELLTMTGSAATGMYAAGDVSPDGILYLFGSNRFVAVDLNSNSPNYLVATQLLSYSTTINDFAFSPVDGKIYGITSTSSRQLFQFDPATNTMTILGNVAGLTTETNDSFGTAFMDNEGNLYIGNNTSGNIYKIAKPNSLTSTSSISASLYSSSLAGKTPGDGARCSSQIILPKANNDQACNPSGSTVSITINVAGNDAAGSYTLNKNSVRLIDETNQRVTLIHVTQGIFSVNTTSGEVTFQPAADFTSGTASVTYSIADNLGNISAPATISITVCTPMPVTLISLKAQSEQQATQLTWVTSEESNSDHFEIQRSSNAKTWITVGEEKASGESTVNKTYYFNDMAPTTGVNYYRLKMIDKDDTFAYSLIINVVNAEKYSFIFSPNPTTDFVTISGLKGGEKIKMISASGIEMSTKLAIGTSFKYDISKLPTGIYIMVVTDSLGKVITCRIAKE